MKKRRLLSMLLTLAMTVSSLPMTMATSVSAADAASENLAEGVVVVTDATATEEDEHGGYLSLGGRLDRYSSLQYVYNFKYGTKYRITFDARQSVPSNSEYTFRVQSKTAGTQDYWAWTSDKYAVYMANTDLVQDGKIIALGDTVKRNGTNAHWLHSDSMTPQNLERLAAWHEDFPVGSDMPAESYAVVLEGLQEDAVAALLATNPEATEDEQNAAKAQAKTDYDAEIAENPVKYYSDYTIVSDNIQMKSLSANGAWVEDITYHFTFCDKPEGVEDDTVLDTVAIFAGTNGKYTQAFDIDNFVLEEYDAEADKWTVCASHDFDTAEDIIGSDAGCFKMGKSGDVTTVSANVAPVITVAGDADYFRVNDTTSVEIGFDDNSTIPAGEYELSADIRYAYSTAVEKPADYTDVTAVVNTGNDEIASIDTTTVKNVWSELNTSFVLAEDTALDDLTFVITSEDECDLDVKSVELYCTEEYVLGETVSSDDLLNGATATYSGLVADVVASAEDEENGVLTVASRSWDTGNATSSLLRFFVDPTDLATETKYYLDFDVRNSTPTNRAVAFRIYTNATHEVVSYTSGDTTESYGNNQISTPSAHNKWGWYVPTDGSWGTYKGEFTLTALPTGNLEVKIQRGTGDELNSFEIDNLELYYYDAENAKQTILSENFDDPDASLAGTGIGKFDKWGSPEIVHNFGKSYKTLTLLDDSTASIEYDLTDLGLTNGVYALTTELMLPAYDAFREVGYYAVNNRTADIIAEYSDGSTKTYTQDFTAYWSVPTVTEIYAENNVSIDYITIKTDVSNLPDMFTYYKETPEEDLAFNVGLTKVKDLIVEPEIPAEVSDDDAILANIEGEFEGVDLIDSEDIATFRKGNKYLTLFGFKNNWHTYKIKVAPYVDHLLEEGKTYYLAYETRSGVQSNRTPSWRGSGLTDLITNKDRDYFANYNASEDWTTLKFAYTAGQTFTILSSQDIYGVYPIDIDNIRVFAEGEDPIYLNDFNDIDVGTVSYGTTEVPGVGVWGHKLSGTSAINPHLNKYTDALEAFYVNTKQIVVQEEPYYEVAVVSGTADPVDVVYTDGNTELAAGKYELSAKLRNTRFYYDNLTPSYTNIKNGQIPLAINESDGLINGTVLYTTAVEGDTTKIYGDVPYDHGYAANGTATEAEIYDLSDLVQKFTYTSIDYNGAKEYGYQSTFSAITYVNNNFFNIKAVATTADGTVESNTVKVDNTWTDLEFVFNVAEDTVLESITFVVDSPVVGQSVMNNKALYLGMKDIDLAVYVDEEVAAVEEAIEALPEAADVTVDDETEINEAKALYDDLTDDQKATVKNASKLTDVLAALETAKAAAEKIENDKKAAAAVDALIDAIKDVENQADDIRAARAAYNKLTDDQKAYVTKLATLEAAEEALAALEGRSEFVLPFEELTEENTYVTAEGNVIADATAKLSGSDAAPTAEPGLAGNHYLHVNSTDATKNGSFGYMLDDSIPAGTDIYIGFDIRAYTKSDTATSSQRVHTNVNGQHIWDVNFPEADRTFANVTADYTAEYTVGDVTYASVKKRGYTDAFSKTFAYPSVFQITEQVYAGTYSVKGTTTGETGDVSAVAGQFTSGQNYYTTTYATEGLGLLTYYRGNRDLTTAKMQRISNTISAEMLYVSNQWTHTEMVIKDIVSDTTGLRFSMNRGTSVDYNQAFDVDNIVIFYFENNDMANEPIYLSYQNFEGVTNFDDVVSRSWAADKVILTPGSTGGSGSNIASYMNAVIIEDAYTFDVPQGNSVTFTWDNLPAGDYVLTGNVRHDYSIGGKTADVANGTGATKLNVSFVSGEAATASADADPIAITTAVTAIPEGVTFTQTADGAASLTLSVESGMSFKYSDLALTKVVETTDDDAEAAATVDATIAALPAVDALTLDDKATVEAARADYAALTPAQQTLVKNLATLEAAEAKIVALEQDKADAEAAAAVDAKIAAIGEVTLASETAITDARAAYTALNNNAKGKVTALATLEAAEATLATLKQDKKDAEDAAAVDATINALPAVGDLTLDNKGAVEAARAAYEALNENAKGKVTALETLEAAEKQIEKLLDAPEDGQVLSNIENRMGGALIDSEDVVSWEDGNQYMTVYNRRNNWDGFLFTLDESKFDKAPEEGKTYYVSFDLRASTGTSAQPKWRNNQSYCVPVQGTSGANMAYYFANDWTTGVYKYITNQEYFVIGGTTNPYEAYAFDVDNIKVYNADNPTDVLYTIDFEDDTVGAATSALAAYGITPRNTKTANPAKANPTLNDYPELLKASISDVQLTIGVDEPYYQTTIYNGTERLADPVFTDTTATAIEAGVYTLTASLRDNHFNAACYAGTAADGKDTPYAGSDGDPYNTSDLVDTFIYYYYDVPDNTGTDYEAQVYKNNNYFDVTAVITTVEGLVLRSETVKVYDVWADYEFEFDFYEAANIASIEFEVENPVLTKNANNIMSDKTLTLAMKDIDLEKTGDVTIADIESDVGVKIVIDEDSVNEDGEITAKIYAISKTYPVDITSITFTLDVPEYLTIDTFVSELDANAPVAVNPENGAFAWFYDVYSEGEYFTIDGEHLIATATLKVADDGIDENKTATIGLKDDTDETPRNFTILGDPDDATYKGYILDFIGDSVIVNNLIRVVVSDATDDHGNLSATFDKSVAEGSTITVADTVITVDGTAITATADDHYDFIGWYNGDAKLDDREYTVDADYSITAKYEIHDYNVTLGTGVTGATTANNGVDYEFEVTSTADSYTVFVQIGDAAKVPYTAVEGVYTIKGTDIVADIEITVVEAEYVSISVKAGNGFDAFETVTLNVIKGEALNADQVEEINAAIAAATVKAGYTYAGISGDKTTGDIRDNFLTDMVFNGDATYYAVAAANEYTFTAPTGMTATVNGEALAGTVTVEDTIELTADESATTIILDVTADGVSIKDADGKYIVPASVIMGEAELAVESVTYRLITDDTYKALATGTQILVITSALGETGYAFDGVSMFYDSKLGGYATVIADADAATSLTIAAKLTETDVKATEIAHTGDVNGDGKINSTDALYVSTMLHTPANENITVRMRLEANLYNTDETITTVDAAWILKQWIG